MDKRGIYFDISIKSWKDILDTSYEKYYINEFNLFLNDWKQIFNNKTGFFDDYIPGNNIIIIF